MSEPSAVLVLQQSWVYTGDRLSVGWLGPFFEGYRESRRCSRDTYPELFVTQYTSIRRESLSQTADEVLEMALASSHSTSTMHSRGIQSRLR